MSCGFWEPHLGTWRSRIWVWPSWSLERHTPRPDLWILQFVQSSVCNFPWDPSGIESLLVFWCLQWTFRCGTPEYFAPEVISFRPYKSLNGPGIHENGHEFVVKVWSIRNHFEHTTSVCCTAHCVFLRVFWVRIQRRLLASRHSGFLDRLCQLMPGASNASNAGNASWTSWPCQSRNDLVQEVWRSDFRVSERILSKVCFGMFDSQDWWTLGVFLYELLPLGLLIPWIPWKWRARGGTMGNLWVLNMRVQYSVTYVTYVPGVVQLHSWLRIRCKSTQRHRVDTELALSPQTKRNLWNWCDFDMFLCCYHFSIWPILHHLPWR